VRDGGAGTVVIGRVYDPPDDGGRARVLVDRLWPRGLRKEAAGLDEWPREIAPSTQLRQWYRHEPGRFGEFRRRYRDELADPGRREPLERLRELARDRGVVLLTATRDPSLSHASVLAELLTQDAAGGEPG
jgi:uncharacterized protein YeaO (DUF488 family)